jgi:hypothetical protein
MSTPKSDARARAVGQFLALLALLLACTPRAKKARSDADSSVPPPSAHSDPIPRVTANTHGNTPQAEGIPGAVSVSSWLLALPVSAYHVSLHADEGGFTLLSEKAVYRLVPGRAPVETPLALGFGATARPSAVVFWADGAIREGALPGGKTRRLASLASRPQSFLTSGQELAWIERAESGDVALRALVSGKAHTTYTASGSIEAATMLSDWVFFVERAKDATWRIGGVKTAGGAPVFSDARRGRTPSMLVARRDLHYYDGNTREVRRLSPDFEREDVLARDFVCSPIAVWDHVYCAQVEGISEIREGQAPLRLVEGTAGGPVAALAANARHVAWVADAGPDKLEVRALPLAAPAR